MKFYSSNSAMRSLIAVILLLLLLHIKSTSPTLRKDESEVVKFAQDNALQNALLSVAKQKPRKCQIYSRLTRKHIQIFKRRVVAQGEDQNRHSIIEKISQTFGVVTMRGVEANRYLCMNSRGKLIARKRLAPDRSCWFREIIEPSYYTSFVNFKYSSWHIGFNRHGKAKKGNKTTQNQVACNFLVRNLEKSEIPPQETDIIFRELATKIRLGILKDRQHSLSRKRNRRHRFQTEYPMDTQHLEEPTNFSDEHIAEIPSWLINPPSNTSSLKRTEWILRVTDFMKKNDYSLELNTTGWWGSMTLTKPSKTPLQSPKYPKKKRKNGKRKRQGGKATKSVTEKKPSKTEFIKIDVEFDKDRINTTASPEIKTVAQKTPLLSKAEPEPEKLPPATRMSSGGGGKRHGKGKRARKKGKKITEISPDLSDFQDTNNNNNNKNKNTNLSREKFDKDIFLRTVEPSITTIISNTLDVKRMRTNRGKRGQKNTRTRKRTSSPRT